MPLLSHPAASAVTELLLATLLGGAVGYERERHERPAGLRTHVLVCLAAALITVVSMGQHNDSHIAAQIVSGVGFLGAGTIMRDNGGLVRGLTTAASLWLVAGIGIAVGCGGGYEVYACVATGIALVTLTLLGRLELALGHLRSRQDVTLLMDSASGQVNSLASILGTIQSLGVRVRQVETVKLGDGCLITLALAMPHTTPRTRLDDVFVAERSVLHHEWTGE